MKMPQEFGENLDIAYHWFAKLVASEGAEVTDHAKRMTLARNMLAGDQSIFKYVYHDMVEHQDFEHSTPQDLINARLAELADDCVALGFGDYNYVAGGRF